jgi:hypothetical protein
MVKPQSNDHAGQPSQADIARALGISPARITALKARGMPVHSVEAAAEWRTLHLREHVHRRPAPGRVQPPASVPAAAAAQAPAPSAGHVTYTEARRREAVARAIMAERSAQEQAGELVRADEWAAALAKRVVAFREGLLQLPARLAPELAAASDQATVHRLLEDGLHQALAHLREEAERELP